MAEYAASSANDDALEHTEFTTAGSSEVYRRKAAACHAHASEKEIGRT